MFANTPSRDPEKSLPLSQVPFSELADRIGAETLPPTVAASVRALGTTDRDRAQHAVLTYFCELAPQLNAFLWRREAVRVLFSPYPGVGVAPVQALYNAIQHAASKATVARVGHDAAASIDEYHNPAELNRQVLQNSLEAVLAWMNVIAPQLGHFGVSIDELVNPSSTGLVSKLSSGISDMQIATLQVDAQVASATALNAQLSGNYNQIRHNLVAMGAAVMQRVNYVLQHVPEIDRHYSRFNAVIESHFKICVGA